MYPGELFLGIHAYELGMVVGMVTAIILADRMAIKAGFSIPLQRQLVISAVTAILFGLLGAAFFQSFYDFLETGEFSLNAGLTFYGGLIVGVGVFLLMWFVLTKPLKLSEEAKKQFPSVANIAAVLIPMAHGFGRIGCLLSGCCHGRITDAWYGVPHYNVWIGDSFYKKVNVVPIQLFEAIFLFVLAGIFFCLYMRSAKRGRNRQQTPLLPMYMIGYGIWRFVIEYFRADERGKTVVSFLTPSQLIAVVFVVGGIIYLLAWYFTRKRGKITETGVSAGISEVYKEYSNDENGRNTGV